MLGRYEGKLADQLLTIIMCGRLLRTAHLTLYLSSFAQQRSFDFNGKSSKTYKAAFFGIREKYETDGAEL